MSNKIANNIVETNVEVLHRVSSEIDLNDVVKTAIVEHALLKAFNRLNKKVKGLAGIQVGQAYRAILLRYEVDKDPIIAFNPVVLFSIGSRKSNEGCESEGKQRYVVKRPLLAKVKYYTRYKDEVVEWIPFSKARVFCHEVDHLDGVLLSDKGIPVEG